jgi:hypothetical protein
MARTNQPGNAYAYKGTRKSFHPQPDLAFETSNVVPSSSKGINVNAVSLLSQSTFFAHEAALQFVL